MKPAFLAVDWGTSSFRAWMMDHAGMVLDERVDKTGMATLTPELYPLVLAEHLAAFGVGADVPVLICGMAGAAQGWRQAPYLDTPARLSDIAGQAIHVSGVANDVRILPGIAQRLAGAWDVMRGEETILLGASLRSGYAMTVCLPGTHSKWAVIREGRLESFDTAMTGEVFGLLSQHSTLSHALAGESPALGSEFERAVAEALARPERILRKLFSIRAKSLLADGWNAPDGLDRLSGLLIGLEIAGTHKPEDGPVMLIASGIHHETYARTFAVAGISYEALDAEPLVRGGLYHAACAIWPEVFDRDTG